MSQYEPAQDDIPTPAKSSNRGYVIAAVVLVIVIVVCIILLITEAIPALRGTRTTKVVAESTATTAPTSTRTPATEQVETPATTDREPAGPIMQDTDTPLYDFVSAGARPAVDWTGFFGKVEDTAGAPVQGLTVIVWDESGRPTVPPVKTDPAGAYEVRLADGPRAGLWSIQLLTNDNRPASHAFSFRTDTDTQGGIQQIQVLWKEIP